MVELDFGARSKFSSLCCVASYKPQVIIQVLGWWTTPSLALPGFQLTFHFLFCCLPPTIFEWFVDPAHFTWWSVAFSLHTACPFQVLCKLLYILHSPAQWSLAQVSQAGFIAPSAALLPLLCTSFFASVKALHLCADLGQTKVISVGIVLLFF